MHYFCDYDEINNKLRVHIKRMLQNGKVLIVQNVVK